MLGSYAEFCKMEARPVLFKEMNLGGARSSLGEASLLLTR